MNSTSQAILSHFNSYVFVCSRKGPKANCRGNINERKNGTQGTEQDEDNNDDEEWCLLGCYAVWLLEEPTFRRNPEPPSSE
jgi:hypothetical protein